MKVFGRPYGHKNAAKDWIEIPSGVQHNPPPSTERGKRRAKAKGNGGQTKSSK